MRVILNEGSRPNEIGYHFTDIDSLSAIIDSNFMKATNNPRKDNFEVYGITRYRLTFLDGSELNIDKEDKKFLDSYFSAGSDTYFNKITNNRLKEKIKRFNIKSKDEIRIEKYEYTSFKNLIGKKSWSYTRRPEGTRYRNFETIDSVRIGIDIHKLTEKGYKIIPFSWLTHTKSSPYNEFEERVFGEGRRENGTDNFMDFVTEIAFPYNYETFSDLEDVQFCYDEIFTVMNLESSARNVLENLDKKYSLKQLGDRRQICYNGLKVYSSILSDQLNNVKKKRLENENDLYQIIKPVHDDYNEYIERQRSELCNEINQMNSKIKIVIVDPLTGKEIDKSKLFKRYLNKQVKEFISDVDECIESGISFNKNYHKIILTDPRCQQKRHDLWLYYKNIISKIPYYEQLCKKCDDMYEKYEKLSTEIKSAVKTNIPELNKRLKLIYASRKSV